VRKTLRKQGGLKETKAAACRETPCLMLEACVSQQEKGSIKAKDYEAIGFLNKV